MEITELPGYPPIPAGAYRLADHGYEEREYLVAGTAARFEIVGERTGDGRWTARAATAARYCTRIVVRQPADPARASGVVAVEWNNVSGGIDIGPDWMLLHRGFIERGDAWVGVTAQKAGIDGGGLVEGLHLRLLDADRYAPLDHPGDAWSYDIYTQVGQLLRSGSSPVHQPDLLLALGESQSAAFLVTYINAIDRQNAVFDGFLVHGRSGMGAATDGYSRARSTNPDAPPEVLYPSPERIRPDARVPVLVLQSETDVVSLGGGLPRQPDGPNLRQWELAGAAHADTYLLVAGFYDDGTLDARQLAERMAPTTEVAGGRTAFPVNSGPQHHYVGLAAFEHLAAWAAGGAAPPAAERLVPAADGRSLETDRLGLAVGGIRTPWVDVPLVRLSGLGQEGEGFGILFGRTEPLAPDELIRLYPGGRDDYLARFAASLDRAVAGGWIRAGDRPEILGLAAAGWERQMGA